MAETVKKSRIVSDDNEDDNLEDALMEEFNMRLKSCMSQDDLQQDPAEKPAEPSNEPPNELKPQTPFSDTINLDFIRAEKEDYYDTPTNHQLNGFVGPPPPPEPIYEPIAPPAERVDEIVYENVANRPNLTLTDLSDVRPPTEPIGSVKDRMLLSTDATPCLLFSQTVTSPMLTPSDENIDFLRGFQRVDSASSTPPSNADDKSAILDDMAPVGNVERVANVDEVIYENYNRNGLNYVHEENLYENVENLKRDSAPSADDFDKIEVIEPEVVDETDLDDLNANFDDRNANFDDLNANLDGPKLPNDDFDQNCDKAFENKEFNGEELKLVDIMKQIRQFECDDSTQVVETYVETTTMESNSTVDGGKALKKKKTKKTRKEEKENISVNGSNTNSNSNSNSNISNNNNDEECYFYNVNVKNLCRSFGDLTKLTEETLKSTTDRFNNVTIKKLVKNKLQMKNTNQFDINNRTKSSFSKFDALQKKNVLHVRSSDSSKAQEKFNGGQLDSTNCRSCDKAVFQMEQIKAEKAIWHKNCFRCNECNKQLNVDTYQSHEGALYCKPHFKALFAPKAVEDDTPQKPRKPELITHENQPLELPPDVVRASDKPDLGLEELQSLNVKQRFQVFENHQQEINELDRSAINVKRSPSILSKLARFQAKGMDIGVADDCLNGIPIVESSSDGEVDDDNETNNDELNGEDADLIRAKRVQKEKPFHFTGMNDVKNRWEQGEQATGRDERREERKQEIQSIRNRLFMGKQGKMKEAYQQAVIESESCTNLYKEKIEITDTKSIKERFEKGDVANSDANQLKDEDCEEVYESEISKNSRSLFLELDANASKAPQVVHNVQTPKLDVKKAREAYISKAGSGEDVIKSSIEQVDNIEIRTADIQQRFKFFETYKEPEQRKREFRITPPREGQVKGPTPDRDVYRDPEVVRSEEQLEDSSIATQSHTATKMLNKFRQMEESHAKEPDQPIGPKPLKCFTPPPETARVDPSNSEGDEESECSDEGEEEEEEENEEVDEADRGRYMQDGDLIEAQKAARAKQLRAKFEKWEANEIKKEQNGGGVNIYEEFADEQSQVESTKALRARFESMKSNGNETNRSASRVKVNRFVEMPSMAETCDSCQSRVYPLEKISVHNRIYHKSCFKCMECSSVLRMDSYSYNQGLLYCLPHFKRLFISKGNYDTGFGLGQHKEKWNNATVA